MQSYIIYLVIKLKKLSLYLFFLYNLVCTYGISKTKRIIARSHTLWLDGKSKLKTPINIDKVISAELPNQDLYPKLHKVVSSYMIHGSCGCMI